VPTGGLKAEPLVQSASSGIVIGHPQDHLVGLAFGCPAHDLADQGTCDTPSPVARVDPHRHKVHTSRSVGLSEDCGQADVEAARAGDEVGRRWSALGPLLPDLDGVRGLCLQGAGEGVGRLG
jgi:hypothetical protein